ncbi:hypothetical protein ACIGKR_31515 [Rhodococcus qingshengii]|uniref:hypothetical protein n=1 Tax=Rhodococcus qingshengii TaxID=334542 RepID=UPI0037C795B2
MTTHPLLDELNNPHRPLSDILYGISTGALPSPASTGLPAERWLWLADLLTHPRWGMTAIVDGLDHVCAPVARLCQLTAHPIHPLNVRELWAAEQLPTIELIAEHSPHEDGHWEVLNAALELITDGLDHCNGLETSGIEAVTSAFTAVITAQDAATVRASITAAVEHWVDPTCATASAVSARLGAAS